uniref:F5/8 type C domain-containing protein n=1 Tax=Magallana gigas TaxID=29159 RepID=A0A8W8NSC7_MAGGI
MAVLIWLRFVFLFGFSHCYINLSRKPTTTVTQSSTYTGTIFHNASLATDGTNKTTERFCSHTDVNHTKAWFQVDLGGKYSIKSVKIFYRREGFHISAIFQKKTLNRFVSAGM